MLQAVAIVISSMLAIGALALIGGLLAHDRQAIVRALRNDRRFDALRLAMQPRIARHDRRACVISVRSQSAPRHAAA